MKCIERNAWRLVTKTKYFRISVYEYVVDLTRWLQIMKMNLKIMRTPSVPPSVHFFPIWISSSVDVLQCRLFQISLNFDERCLSMSAENVLVSTKFIPVCIVGGWFEFLVQTKTICLHGNEFWFISLVILNYFI